MRPLVLRRVAHPRGIFSFNEDNSVVASLEAGELFVVLEEGKNMTRILSPRLGIRWVPTSTVGRWTSRVAAP